MKRMRIELGQWCPMKWGLPGQPLTESFSWKQGLSLKRLLRPSSLIPPRANASSSSWPRFCNRRDFQINLDFYVIIC